MSDIESFRRRQAELERLRALQRAQEAQRAQDVKERHAAGSPEPRQVLEESLGGDESRRQAERLNQRLAGQRMAVLKGEAEARASAFEAQTSRILARPQEYDFSLYKGGLEGFRGDVSQIRGQYQAQLYGFDRAIDAWRLQDLNLRAREASMRNPRLGELRSSNELANLNKWLGSREGHERLEAQFTIDYGTFLESPEFKDWKLKSRAAWEDYTAKVEKTVGREGMVQSVGTPYRPGGLPKPGSAADWIQKQLKPAYSAIGGAVESWDKAFTDLRERIFGGASGWGEKARELKLGGKSLEASLYYGGSLFASAGVGAFEGSTFLARPKQWVGTLQGLSSLAMDPLGTLQGAGSAFMADPARALMYGGGQFLGSYGTGLAIAKAFKIPSWLRARGVRASEAGLEGSMKWGPSTVSLDEPSFEFWGSVDEALPGRGYPTSPSALVESSFARKQLLIREMGEDLGGWGGELGPRSRSMLSPRDFEVWSSLEEAHPTAGYPQITGSLREVRFTPAWEDPMATLRRAIEGGQYPGMGGLSTELEPIFERAAPSTGFRSLIDVARRSRAPAGTYSPSLFSEMSSPSSASALGLKPLLGLLPLLRTQDWEKVKLINPQIAPPKAWLRMPQMPVLGLTPLSRTRQEAIPIVGLKPISILMPGLRTPQIQLPVLRTPQIQLPRMGTPMMPDVRIPPWTPPRTPPWTPPWTPPYRPPPRKPLKVTPSMLMGRSRRSRMFGLFGFEQRNYQIKTPSQVLRRLMG